MTTETAEFTRLLFTTPLGETKAVEISSDRLTDVMSNGMCFDGSSVKGYAKVNRSDLVLRIHGQPYYNSWDKDMALALCRVYDTEGKAHPLDAIRALESVTSRAREMGFRFMAGSEIEFFLVSQTSGASIRPGDSAGYYSSPPADRGLHLRRDVSKILRRMGLETTVHHHEVAKGQHEIGIRYCDAMKLADTILIARSAISERALEDGLIATFMPKPFAEENGSGLHIHQSLWDLDGKKNLFADDEGGFSELAKHFTAGLLEHASGLAALTSPTVNSYKRLRPGFEAPTKIAWGPMNRTTMIRVPYYMESAPKTRIELRCPDPSCSPHLALTAILAAGLDGIERELQPPETIDGDLFETGTDVVELPTSLNHAISELKADKVLREALGSELIEYISKARSAEWSQYLSVNGRDNPSEISEWEVERYLLTM